MMNSSQEEEHELAERAEGKRQKPPARHGDSRNESRREAAAKN
jgi:hypothetical protein